MLILSRIVILTIVSLCQSRDVLSGQPTLDHPLRSSKLKLLEEFVEETTPRSQKQIGSGFFYNDGSNPVPNTYNPYNPLSTMDAALNTETDPLEPRAQEGLDAFTARRASNTIGFGQNTKIKFEDTAYQLGDTWNEGTGEFIPTLAGYFFFTFNAVTDRFTHFRISLQVNGEDIVSAFGDVSGYQMAGNSAMVQMNAGDKAYLVLQEGRLFDVSSSRAYTTFTGFRIL